MAMAAISSASDSLHSDPDSALAVMPVNNINQIYACTTCNESFTDIDLLIQHQDNHTKKILRGLHICKVCDADFHTYLTLKTHMLTHSKEKQHKCPVCGKGFIFGFDLKKHFKSHKSEKKYVCEICEKPYLKRQNYENHKLLHSNKPLMCNECNCEFADRKSLKEHIRAHKGVEERSNICEICNKSFSSKSYLRKHVIIHERPPKLRKKILVRIKGGVIARCTTNGTRPYQCDICDKTFGMKSILSRHKLSHKKDRPHKCKVCSKGFSLIYNLKSHELTHKHEKPYTCDFCNKGFIQSGNFKRHRLTHTKEKPYRCEYCRKHFSRKDRLKRHYAVHDEESE